MGKESAVHALNEIESNYSVDSIKVNGIHFWPILRIYFGSNFAFGKDTRISNAQALSLSKLFSIFYGLLNYFKPWNFMALSGSDQRKNVEGIWVDKMDFLNELIGNGEILELPNPKHKPRNLLKNKRVSSKMSLYADMYLLERFIRPKIEGQEIIKQIEHSLGIQIDEAAIAKRFLAQIRIASLLIKWKTPTALFLITPYTNFGFVYAFKKRQLPVIEFQHGTINQGHFAYQINRKFQDALYPDYLFSTGSLEIDALANSAYVQQNHIIPVGSFYIDYILSKKIDRTKFDQVRKSYKTIVCISAQDRLEEQYIPFLKEVASQDLSIGYWLLPRFRTAEYYQQFGFSDNVFLIENYNTYEAIVLSDFHSCINSTTAIESLALGTRNVLMNVNNLSKSFFEDALSDETLTCFAGNPEEFLERIHSGKEMSKEEIRSKQNNLVKLGYKDNLKRALSDILDV